MQPFIFFLIFNSSSDATSSVCSSFNESVTNSYYTSSDDSMAINNELEKGRKERPQPYIYLEGLTKTMKSLSGQCSDIDSNKAPAECNSEALSLQPSCSAKFCGGLSSYCCPQGASRSTCTCGLTTGIHLNRNLFCFLPLCLQRWQPVGITEMLQTRMPGGARFGSQPRHQTS